MFEKFTEKAINVISTAQKEAKLLNENKICPAFLLLGILQLKSNICSRLLAYAGVDVEHLRERLRSTKCIHNENATFTTESRIVFKKAFEIAKKYQNTSIIPEHLLLALIWEENSEAAALLKNYDVDINKLKQTLIKLLVKN